MASAMANVYYKLIKNNKRTIDQVQPDSLKEEVQAMLDAEAKETTTESNQ